MSHTWTLDLWRYWAKLRHQPHAKKMEFSYDLDAKRKLSVQIYLFLKFLTISFRPTDEINPFIFIEVRRGGGKSMNPFPTKKMP